MSWQKADLERSIFDRAGDQFERQRAQFEAEKNELEVKLTLSSLIQQVEIDTTNAEFENEKLELNEQIERQVSEANKMSEQLNSLKALMMSNEDELEKKSHDFKRLEDENSGLEVKIEKLEARLAHVEIEKASEAKLVAEKEEALGDQMELLREEIDSFKQELQWSKAKLANIRRRRNEERRAVVHKRKVDELTLLLANFKLNDKRDENRELHAASRTKVSY